MNTVGWTDWKDVNALKIYVGNWPYLRGRKKWMNNIKNPLERDTLRRKSEFNRLSNLLNA
jgi:hypothetical protein